MEGARRVLNPRTYFSPSRAYSLTVDPTDRYGGGPADCRCSQDGNVVWAHRLPYTLWDASVDDSGRVIGYAYTHGLSQDWANAEPGELIVSLLSPDGKPLSEERYKRESSRVVGGAPANPWLYGMIRDGVNRRLLLRIADPVLSVGKEKWWIYDLESGKRVGILEPRRFVPRTGGDVVHSIFQIRAVPGTPLILTHWFRISFHEDGGVFTLADLSNTDSQAVWSLVLEGDYSVPGDKEAEERLRTIMDQHSEIVDAEQPRCFTVPAVKRHERISFSVQEAEDGRWTVRETARTPYDVLSFEPAKVTQALPPIQLDEVAVVQLGGGRTRPATPIHDVREFGFDPEGRICVLSVPGDAEPHLAHVTDKGIILKTLRVPVGEASQDADLAALAHVGGRKFVITICRRGSEKPAQCFIADFQAETVTQLRNFGSSGVESLAGFPNGRFAALIGDSNTACGGISMFDADGNLLWQKAESGVAGKHDEVRSACDITRYDDESIAVLNEQGIQLFGTKGVFLRSFDLNGTGQQVVYLPERFAVDSQGGFSVFCLGIDSPSAILHTDAAGRIAKTFSPKFSDGRPLGVYYRLCRAPDGRLWTTDGDVLLRLADDGTVDRILGEEASLATIHRPSYTMVGPNDCVYVADDRNSAVHVFEANGNAKGVCIPDPNDVRDVSYVRHITVSPEGDVFVCLGRDDNAYVHFDTSLKRIGRTQTELTDVNPDWYFQPTGPLCWIVGYADVFLVKDLQSVVRTISRRADGMWLESPSTLGVARDGSAAVLAGGQSGEVSLTIYAPDGEARVTFVAPRGWFSIDHHVAYDGQCAYVRTGNEVYVIDPESHGIGLFRLPGGDDENPWEGPFLAAEGKQLWFLDREELMLHKYAIPRQYQGSERQPSRGASSGN